MILVSPTTYSGLERFGLFGLFKSRPGTVATAQTESNGRLESLKSDPVVELRPLQVVHCAWSGATHPEAHLKVRNDVAA